MTSKEKNITVEYYVFLKFFKYFYLFLRQRETEHEWGCGREGDTESEAGSRL